MFNEMDFSDNELWGKLFNNLDAISHTCMMDEISPRGLFEYLQSDLQQCLTASHTKSSKQNLESITDKLRNTAFFHKLTPQQQHTLISQINQTRVLLNCVIDKVNRVSDLYAEPSHGITKAVLIWTHLIILQNIVHFHANKILTHLPTVFHNHEVRQTLINMLSHVDFVDILKQLFTAGKQKINTVNIYISHNSSTKPITISYRDMMIALYTLTLAFENLLYAYATDKQQGHVLIYQQIAKLLIETMGSNNITRENVRLPQPSLFQGNAFESFWTQELIAHVWVTLGFDCIRDAITRETDLIDFLDSPKIKPTEKVAEVTQCIKRAVQSLYKDNEVMRRVIDNLESGIALDRLHQCYHDVDTRNRDECELLHTVFVNASSLLFNRTSKDMTLSSDVLDNFGIDATPSFDFALSNATRNTINLLNSTALSRESKIRIALPLVDYKSIPAEQQQEQLLAAIPDNITYRHLISRESREDTNPISENTDNILAHNESLAVAPVERSNETGMQAALSTAIKQLSRYVTDSPIKHYSEALQYTFLMNQLTNGVFGNTPLLLSVLTEAYLEDGLLLDKLNLHKRSFHIMGQVLGANYDNTIMIRGESRLPISKYIAKKCKFEVMSGVDMLRPERFLWTLSDLVPNSLTSTVNLSTSKTLVTAYFTPTGITSYAQTPFFQDTPDISHQLSKSINDFEGAITALEKHNLKDIAERVNSAKPSSYDIVWDYVTISSSVVDFETIGVSDFHLLNMYANGYLHIMPWLSLGIFDEAVTPYTLADLVYLFYSQSSHKTLITALKVMHKKLAEANTLLNGNITFRETGHLSINWQKTCHCLNADNVSETCLQGCRALREFVLIFSATYIYNFYAENSIKRQKSVIELQVSSLKKAIDEYFSSGFNILGGLFNPKTNKNASSLLSVLRLQIYSILTERVISSHHTELQPQSVGRLLAHNANDVLDYLYNKIIEISPSHITPAEHINQALQIFETDPNAIQRKDISVLLRSHNNIIAHVTAALRSALIHYMSQDADICTILQYAAEIDMGIDDTDNHADNGEQLLDIQVVRKKLGKPCANAVIQSIDSFLLEALRRLRDNALHNNKNSNTDTTNNISSSYSNRRDVNNPGMEWDTSHTDNSPDHISADLIKRITRISLSPTWVETDFDTIPDLLSTWKKVKSLSDTKQKDTGQFTHQNIDVLKDTLAAYYKLAGIKKGSYQEKVLQDLIDSCFYYSDKHSQIFVQTYLDNALDLVLPDENGRTLIQKFQEMLGDDFCCDWKTVQQGALRLMHYAFSAPMAIAYRSFFRPMTAPLSVTPPPRNQFTAYEFSTIPLGFSGVKISDLARLTQQIYPSYDDLHGDSEPDKARQLYQNKRILFYRMLYYLAVKQQAKRYINSPDVDVTDIDYNETQTFKPLTSDTRNTAYILKFDDKYQLPFVLMDISSQNPLLKDLNLIVNIKTMYYTDHFL